MNEFKSLLENELLSDEIRTELKEAVELHKKQLEESIRNELDVEYANKYVEFKKTVEKDFDSVIKESVQNELTELKEDIQKYKDLEVTYAKKLEGFKKQYNKKLSEGFERYVEDRIMDEMDELRESLQEAKMQNFGARIFEAFKQEYVSFGMTPSEQSLVNEISELKEQLQQTKEKLEENVRSNKISGLVKSLSGSKREVMKSILENTKTEMLESRFEQTIDKVLNEHKEEDSRSKPVKESVEIVDGGSDVGYINNLKRLSGIK